MIGEHLLRRLLGGNDFVETELERAAYLILGIHFYANLRKTCRIDRGGPAVRARHDRFRVRQQPAEHRRQGYFSSGWTDHRDDRWRLHGGREPADRARLHKDKTEPAIRVIAG